MPNWYANRRFFKILIADTNRQFFKMRIVNIATSLYHFVINSLLKICIFHSKFETFVLYIEKDCTFKIPYIFQKKFYLLMSDGSHFNLLSILSLVSHGIRISQMRTSAYIPIFHGSGNILDHNLWNDQNLNNYKEF